MKIIRESYEIVTHESTASGDLVECNWIDEEGVIFETIWDVEECWTEVDQAIEHLTNNGAFFPSSSHFNENVRYSTEPEVDYFNGDCETRHFHLDGFTIEEQKSIFDAIVKNK